MLNIMLEIIPKICDYSHYHPDSPNFILLTEFLDTQDSAHVSCVEIGDCPIRAFPRITTKHKPICPLTITL